MFQNAEKGRELDTRSMKGGCLEVHRTQARGYGRELKGKPRAWSLNYKI